jgi:hypothetical protein
VGTQWLDKWKEELGIALEEEQLLEGAMDSVASMYFLSKVETFNAVK